MPEKAILVTGASGYLAAHVVKILLEQGARVRGTVRSFKNTARIEELKNLVKDPKYPLEFAQVDLTKDDGWKRATEGCKALIHTASPFPNVSTSVASSEIISTAVDGTLRALKAAVAANIKKVILTSSCAAIVGTTDTDKNKLYSEEDWTDPNDSTTENYTKSKVLAEKAAWEYLKELPDNDKFELTVINPSLIMGPVLLESNKTSTSVEIMTSILKGTSPAYPKYPIVYCDVRDVAIAHVKALTNEEAAGKRIIINTGTMWLRDIAEIVANEFGPQGYSIRTFQLPYAVCWLGSVFSARMRNVILPKYGKTLSIGNGRMVNLLGINPIPAEKSFKDMAYSLIELGLVSKTKKYRGNYSAL